MTGLGFLHGNWEELKDKTSRVTLIEPVVESVMQLFFQLLIVLIIFGPNLDKGDHIYIINYYRLTDFFKVDMIELIVLSPQMLDQ